jgi:hypothetical protein
VKRILLFGLLAGMLTAGTGCGLYQAVFCYNPCDAACGRSSGCCGDECGESCGPVCGSAHRPIRPACTTRRAVVADCDDACATPCARPCGRATCRTCSPCSDPCADPCGDGCYGRPWHRGPLSCLFALFTPNTWCGPSCGERYWGDFYSDPPDCSDPCDDSGNYTGHGCRSCGGSHRAHARGGYVDDGEPVSEEMELAPRAERATTSAPKPTPAPPRKTTTKSEPMY